MTEIISDAKVDVDSEFSLKKLAKKKVISANGDVAGRVKDIIVKDYNVLGIIISKLGKPDLFIARKFIDNFQQNAVILKIDPVIRIEGLTVFDRNGKRLGKVSKVLRNDTKNEFFAFNVKSSFFKKEQNYSSKDIETISGNVILKIEANDR